MRRGSPIIKKQSVSWSKDGFIVDNGLKELNAFLLVERGKPSANLETGWRTERDVREEYYLYGRQP